MLYISSHPLAHRRIRIGLSSNTVAILDTENIPQIISRNAAEAIINDISSSFHNTRFTRAVMVI